jgi:hypothetical protein
MRFCVPFVNWYSTKDELTTWLPRSTHNEAHTKPIAKNNVFTEGLAIISPLRCMPPAMTNKAPNKIIKGR